MGERRCGEEDRRYLVLRRKKLHSATVKGVEIFEGVAGENYDQKKFGLWWLVVFYKFGAHYLTRLGIA